MYLLAIADAQQKFNLSANTCSFILRLAVSLDADLKVPTVWQHALRQLLPLKYTVFNGCGLCGRYLSCFVFYSNIFRYIFKGTETTCNVCLKPRKNQRVLYLPIAHWLQFMFMFSKTFVESLMQSCNASLTHITDWCDGDYCQGIVKHFKNKKTIFISLASDGLAMFKTTNSSLTPLFFIVNNLLSSVRKDLRFYFPVSVEETGSTHLELQQLLFFTELSVLEHTRL